MSTSGQPQGRPVLLVVANPALRDRLTRCLRSIGARVIAVPRALEAIDLLPSEPLALMVVTIDGKDMQELVALARLRELPQGRDAAAIAIAPEGSELQRIKMLASQLNITRFVSARVDNATLAAAALPALRATKPTSAPRAAARGKLTDAELRAAHGRIVKQDFFERMGLERDADTGDVRRAYVRLMKRFTPDNMDSPSREARRLLREVLEGINAAFTTLRDPARRTGYRHSLEYDQSTVRSGGRSAAVIQDDIFSGPAASSVGPLQPQPLPEPTPEPVRRPEPKPEPMSRSAAAVADTEVVIPSAADLQPPSEPQAAEPEAIEEPEPVEPEAAEPAPAEAAEAPTTTIPDTVELGKLAPQPNPDPLDKTGAALLANAAQLKEVLGDHLGAARLLEEALRSDPMNLQYRYSFELATGRYYLHVDRPADARRHLALAANLAPHGDLAAEELIAQIDTPNAPRKRSLGDTIRQYRKRRPPG